MDLWAIIPVKPLALGKSRLAVVLDNRQRAALNQWLFDRVFDAAATELGPGQVIVVSSDAGLLARVRGRGAHALDERAPTALNAALAQACRYASGHGAPAIAVLPADLPEIRGADIAALRAALAEPPSCAIAPDAAELGTNALVLAPPRADSFRFGRRSFAAHLALATARGLATQIVRRPGLAHDLDTPEAYRRFARRRPDIGLRWGEETIAS